MNFRKKKMLLRCPKLIGIAKREASHLKVMFYRDAQAVASHLHNTFPNEALKK